MKLKKIRIGSIEIFDVTTVVSNNDFPEIPLLGMSFLGNFKFEVDTAKGNLKLLRVDAE